MKELVRYFSNAVKDENPCPNLNQNRKSLNATRSLKGVCLVDSFFSRRKEGKRTRSPKRSFLLMVAGLLAIIAGVLVKVYQPYELVFRWKLVFGEGGEIFNLWQKPPVDLYVKIYLFNITNPEEFLAGTEKMKVEEVGPYVYKEIIDHGDVRFNDNSTLSTRPSHPLEWQEELSEGRREDDVLMMVNIALLSISQVAAGKSYFFRLPINVLIRQTKSQPIVKMTAKEFMFGYETPLTTLGNTFLPNWISFDKVGLIDRMYDFNNDFETFYTGEDNPRLSGLYDTYMGSKTLPQWNGDHCSNIDMASDGTKFQSFLEPNDTVKFFRKSMCRPQTMVRSGGDYIVSDMNAYKYVFEDNALDNGYYNEKNKCYCRNGDCQPRGLVDVSDCYYGFPISLSYPHFMDTDPQVVEAIDGLAPNRSKHESYFMIQPKSGLTLKCSVKFQINMHMSDVRSIANVARFSEITVPMLWFEITLIELPDALQNRFNLYLNILPYIDTLGFWGGLTVGALCLLIAVTRATRTLPFAKKEQFENTKYSKVNLRSGIYNSCEMKLMGINDKIFRSPEDDNSCVIDLKDTSNFILEQEQALSDIEIEEIQDSSSSSQLSRTSSDSRLDGTKSPENDQIEYLPTDNDNKGWALGEASSLIDDIGSEHFSSLRTSGEAFVNHEHKASIV